MKPASSSTIWSIVRFRTEPPADPTIAGVPVTLKSSPRARRLRLKVDPRTRRVVLTLPPRMSARKALAWAAGHADWVEATLAAIPGGTPLAPGAELPYRGRPLRIDWDTGRPRRVEPGDGVLRVGGPVDGLAARILRWLKAEALAMLTAETHEFAARAGVTLARVGVGDPTSRWGSCSSSGTIRYSWRLIMAPDFVRRATVAHEVAHLVHMNHGPDFHDLVEQLLGEDATPARRWLRREGAALHQVGRSA